MTFVYDLVLNFNKELYAFYEWDKNDLLYHMKKISLIKVDINTYNDLLNYHVKIDKEFLLGIYSKSEYYTKRDTKILPYATLITDSFRVMAIMVNSSGSIINYSSLLLDEEEDVLMVSDRLPIIKLTYQLGLKREKSNLTRQEVDKIKVIKEDLNTCYRRNNIQKLKYLYYEYFNRQCDEITQIYNELLLELKKDFSKKHDNLYSLIKLSYSQKSV